MKEFLGNILIVDDLVENLRVLAEMLKAKSYKVRKATDGETALLACEASPPNLVLLDIKMPNMDGYEVCRRLKANPKTAEIPVIFISALNEVFDKIKAFEVGARDYISKPFQIEEVIARIENQLTIQKQKILLQEEVKKRREAEEILYQSRALLASILNGSLDGIAAMQAVRDLNTGKIKDFRCIVVNPVISETLRTNKEDLIGKVLLRKYLKKIDINLFDQLINVVETGQPLKRDLYYGFDGNLRWYHFIAIKLGDGFAITIRDITVRKKMELDLQQTNKDLEAFNYSVSHDLTNHIQKVTGFSDIFLDEYEDEIEEEGKEYIEFIKESGLRMASITNSLLMLSRVKNKQLLIKSFNASVLVNNIIKNLIKENPQRKIKWKIHRNIVIEADEDLLSIVLENLINNAWKYTSKKELSEIEFGCLKTKNNQKVYFVKDNGVGFDTKKTNRLFTPFQRLHSQKDFQGNGVGLSTVKRIIERHNGRIWCESEVNKGTVFYFTLLEKNIKITA